MSIFRLSVPVGEEYASLVLTRELDGYDEFLFNGDAADNWQIPAFKWKQDRNPHTDGVTQGDAVYVFDAGLNIAVNETSKVKLEQVLKDDVEFLPIKIVSDNEVWYLLNVTNCINSALNIEKSSFKTRTGGRRGRLVQAIFSPDNIPKNCAFVYPESSSNFMIHGDDLKQQIKDLSIAGIEFNPCKTDTEEFYKEA